MLFDLKCVLAVCTQPPNNDKNPLSVYYLFIQINNIPFFKASCSQTLGRVMSISMFLCSCLQIALPYKVLVCKFDDECQRERGGASRAH